MSINLSGKKIDRAVEHLLELRSERFQSHIGWGKFALTALMTINGAAAISILTFVGTISANPSANLVAVPYLIQSMYAFCMGVSLAALCGALAYFGDGAKIATKPFRIAHALLHSIEDNLSEKITKRPIVDWLAHYLHYFTSVVWLLSWSAFLYGVSKAADALAVIPTLP